MSTEAPPAPPAGTENAAPPANNSAVPAASWASEWIKSDHTLNPSALDKLPDHLKGMKDTLGKYQKFDDVFTSYQSLQAMAGKKALAPLPADAPEAVRTERKQLMDAINGVPADVKGYGLAKPQDLPDAAWNQGLADKAATWASKHSISPAALKELVFDINGGAVKEMLQAQSTNEAKFWSDQDTVFKSQLQQQNIPVDRAESLIEKGVIAMGVDMNDEGNKLMMKGATARMMAMKYAMATGEDRALTNGTGNNGSAMDPMQAGNDIVNNPANPLHAAYHNTKGTYSRADVERARSAAQGFFRQAADARDKANARR